MLLTAIIFVLVMLGISVLLFFMLFILIPAVTAQTQVAVDYLLSKTEHDFFKLQAVDNKVELPPNPPRHYKIWIHFYELIAGKSDISNE